MASFWCSFVEAVTPGYEWPGQWGVDTTTAWWEDIHAEDHVRGAHSRSSSDHRGVLGDPNVTQRKLFTKVRVEESESEDEEEFEDSRENLPPRDLVEPFSACEQVLLPASVIVSSQPSSSSS